VKLHKTLHKIDVITLILCFSLLFICMTGCSISGPGDKDFTARNEELKKLLPEKTGYHWIYSGFAEYGHALALKSINAGGSETVYRLSGEIYDPSGGEAAGDFSLSVDYVISKGSLIQKKTGAKMMDAFDQMELIRTPLNAQTKWEQKVKGKDGKEYELVCTITGINEDDGKVYTVEYKDKNSDFYEKRRIKERTGVIEFEKLWQSPEGPVTMGYALYEDASGYPEKTEMKAFLPPLDKQLRYFGLAEYGHIGTMTKVSESDQQGIYRFNGSYQDGSGIPGDFTVEYIFNYVAGTVQEKVLENTRSGEKDVNSKLHDPILLKLPLDVGHTWQQEIMYEGQKKNMTAQIVSSAYLGRTFYTQKEHRFPVMTVRYTVENIPGYFQNTYVEERSFQKGWGMTGYSHLMKGELDVKDETDIYEVENAIINNMFGYGIARE